MTDASSGSSNTYTGSVLPVISEITDAWKQGNKIAEDFFKEEYILNNAIGRYKSCMWCFAHRRHAAKRVLGRI